MVVVVFSTKPKPKRALAGGVSVLKLRTPLKPKFCSCSKPESPLKKRNRKNSPKIKPLRTSYYYLLLLLLSPFENMYPALFHS